MWKLILIVIILNANCYPNGAPNSACETLEPIHKVEPQPRESLQYVVEVDRDKVPENGQVQITLKSPQIFYTISGFMVQARTAFDEYPKTIGAFVQYQSDVSKAIDCWQMNDTLTHTGSNGKNEIVAVWKAPQGFVGNIIFNATIAESFSKYWTSVLSIPVQILPSEIFGGFISTSIGPIIVTTPSWQRPTYVFTEFTPKHVYEEKQSLMQNFYNDCFESKNCFGAPADCLETKDCEIAASILAKRDTYEFELLTTNPRSAYAAVALSTDDKMGDDSVMECVKESPVSIRAYMSWTNGKSVERLNSNYGIRLLNQSLYENFLYCRLSRDIITVVKSRTFDLVHDNYHILVATGSHVHPNKVGYHDISYLSAASPVALADVRPIESASDLFVRLHGSLMLISWMGFASIGILMARYYRQTWVNSQLFGKDLWFVWHRFFMFLTWVGSIISTILIVLELRGWSSERNPHAILGTITIIICVVQPIGAFFRPHPGTSNRKIFNWLHWLAGNSAFILAIITIFFAVKLSKAQLPEWLTFVLVTYVVFHVLTHLILTILSFISNKSAISPEPIYRPNSFAMKDMTNPRHNISASSIVKIDSPKSSTRKWILSLYIIIVVLFIVVMTCIILLSPIERSWRKLTKTMF